MAIVLPEVVAGEPVRISATTFVAWKKCPDSANARLQGNYSPDSRPAFVGGLAHAVFRRHLSDGPIDDEAFTQVCRQEIGDSQLNYKMGPLGINSSSLGSVIEETRALYQRFVRFPNEGFEGAEVKLKHDGGGGLELVGQVDAVFRADLGGHRLVDWKTGELGEVEDQLGFYSLLWALERDEIPSQVEAVSVLTGESHRSVPTEAGIGQVAAEVSALVSEVRTAWSKEERVERRAGPWCRFCPILDECSEGQAVGELLD